MIVVPILLFALAAVVIVVGGLATLKKLPGNSVFGLRVHEARKSPEAWITAHAVAGPVWLVAGASLTFGALVSLQASGFMWVIPAVTTVVGIIALSYGANLGARTAVLYDQNVSAKKNADTTGGCCSSGGGAETHDIAEAPSVDVNALRQAARQADNQ
ncbi:SdpI family protein [Corynebacterium propinquum]|uniref:SdpI family protein n=1 Tax=Corynebacterium propinquum TaxID=43769 RepID=A0ABT7G1W8_9CORY|nr:SdpI family protein [Corynebacterium propinquum]MCT1818839.1 SdpI family protein [Corynebacterium propinquum]MDK4234811.1 SdpI family protein [Corynebacterium propinquum]MDK4239222.1 SdpI family protein [Corynebacterium propinquum]MDK4251909.1 SdpI family protein [Corynebacterium propinquum]MDK4257642.1 SdpI family protein [Corynebacterium propinquum]